MKIIFKILATIFIAVILYASYSRAYEASMERGEGRLGGFEALRDRAETVFVSVRKLEKGDIETNVAIFGYLIEEQKTRVHLDQSVRVTKLNIELHQRVFKGQTIMEVDTTDLYNQLEQQNITKQSQEINIQRLLQSQNIRNLVPLEVSVTTAANSLRNAQNALKDAEDNLLLQTNLYNIGSIPKTDYDRAERQVRDAHMQVESAQAGLITAESNLAEAKSSNLQIASTAALDLEAQNLNLKSTIARIAEIESRIEKINDMVICPLDGLITELALVEGGLVPTSSPAFAISDADNLIARIRIGEFNIPRIKVGQEVRITGDVLASDEIVTGEVKSISPVATRVGSGGATDQVYVEAEIKILNPTPLLMPGLSVNCIIKSDERLDVVKIPFSAIQEDRLGNMYVYTADLENMVMRRRTVVLGAFSDMEAEILEGPKEGEFLILNSPTASFGDGVKIAVYNGVDE